MNVTFLLLKSSLWHSWTHCHSLYTVLSVPYTMHHHVCASILLPSHSPSFSRRSGRYGTPLVTQCCTSSWEGGRVQWSWLPHRRTPWRKWQQVDRPSVLIPVDHCCIHTCCRHYICLDNSVFFWCSGLCDSLLLSFFRAMDESGPKVLCPAMNTKWVPSLLHGSLNY